MHGVETLIEFGHSLAPRFARIKRLVATYHSRPDNIKDLVTRAKLRQDSGQEASKCYLGELPAKW